MLRQAARMSSWAIPSGRPSLRRQLSYRSDVSFGADSWSPIHLYSPSRCYVLTAGRLYGLTLLSIRLYDASIHASDLWLLAQWYITVVTSSSRTCGSSLRGLTDQDLYGRCHALVLFEGVGCGRFIEHEALSPTSESSDSVPSSCSLLPRFTLWLHATPARRRTARRRNTRRRRPLPDRPSPERPSKTPVTGPSWETPSIASGLHFLLTAWVEVICAVCGVTHWPTLFCFAPNPSDLSPDRPTFCPVG